MLEQRKITSSVTSNVLGVKNCRKNRFCHWLNVGCPYLRYNIGKPGKLKWLKIY